MNDLFLKHNRLIGNTPMRIVRGQMQAINWDSRLICIQGAKGVGKSTLLKQFVKLNYKTGDRSVLYCSADSVYFSSHSILELADKFCINGGERLIIDEIHKYPQWSKEIKEIYDLYPELKVIISGSSLLQLLEGDADLSRRYVKHTMKGLSLCEFLRFYKGIELPVWPLEEILGDAPAICATVNAVCKPVKHFKEYLQFGYYPFFMESRADYYTKLEQVVNFIVDTELPQICGVDVANLRKIKALISIICKAVPFELDAKKLAGAIEVSRDTVIEYLQDLDKADLFNLIYSEKKSIGKLTKPDKIYMENPNLLYALAPSSVEIGTARETFAVSSLMRGHDVEYGKEHGDFKVDSKYVFEVGGAGKDFRQIAGIKDSYVFADDMEYPDGAKLPLWLLGFVE